MKYPYLILLLVFLPGTMNAQSNVKELQALKQHIRQSRDDSNKVLLLNKTVDLLISLDSPGAAFENAIRAKVLADKIHYTYGSVLSLSNMGIISDIAHKNYQSAIYYYNQAINLAEKQHLAIDLDSIIYPRVLNMYFYIGDFPNAMEIAVNRLKVAEQSNNIPLQARYKNLIGFIYLRQGNSTEAEKYYLQYLAFARQIKDSALIADAYNCMGDVYLLQHRYNAAYNNLYSALNIYTKINGHEPGHIKREERIAYTLFKIGKCHVLNGNYKEALVYVLDAVAIIHTVPGNKYDLSAYYITAGDIYKELKDYTNARLYLDTGLRIARAINHNEDTRDAYNYLAQTFALQRKYDSAFHYYLLYDKLKDSIINENTSKAIEQIHTAYEVDKKDKEIALLNKENKLHEVIISRQKLLRNIIIGLSVAVIIIATLLYNRRQLRQKNRFQAELNRQQNELFNTISSIQDKERKRIAQDLHDSLGSLLSAAKLKLSELDEAISVTDPRHTQYATALVLLDEAAAELRNISHNIMPAPLAKIGLVAALQSLINNISSTSGLAIEFVSFGFTERLDEETEMSIYRIILELLNNVVKHARAAKASVQLVRYPSYINISVEDDGVGFDYDDTVRKTKGIGLSNISSRAIYLKGTLEVDSRHGGGTIVFINIPYS